MWFYILTHWRSCPGHNPGTEANQPRICIRDVYMFADNKQEHFFTRDYIHAFLFFSPPQNAGWWRDPKGSGVQQRVPFRSCAASLLLSPVSPLLSPWLRSGFQIPQRTDLTLVWKPSRKETQTVNSCWIFIGGCETALDLWSQFEGKIG